jgi:hypothetical protein
VKSYDIGYATLLRHRTPRLSPAFATYNFPNIKTQYFVNGELEKSVNRLSDTSDSDKEFERDASSEHFEKPLVNKNEVRSTEHTEAPSDSTLNNASADDTLSIEEALDAIIQEEDASSTSKATLEMKETDDEIDNSEDDDIFNH